MASYYLSDITRKAKHWVFLSMDLEMGIGSKLSIANDQFHLIGSGKVEKIWNKTHFICPSLGEIYGTLPRFWVTRNSDEGKVEAMAAFGTADNVLLKWRFQLKKKQY